MTVADQLLPQDLSTAEAFFLVDEIDAFGRPILVLSGGEPLFHPYILDIARYAAPSVLDSSSPRPPTARWSTRK